EGKMSVIGISCGNDSLAFVVIDGKPESFTVIDCETLDLKKHVEKGSLLDTAKYSVETAIKKHKVRKAALLVTDMALMGGSTHPVKHQIEGVLMYNFFKEKIPFEEYNRKRLKKLNNLKKDDDLKSFVKNQYAEECDRG